MTLPPPPPLPEVVPPERIPVLRWRWWIHLVLIGGYLIPRIALGFMRPRHHPVFSSSATGLLVTCLVELAIFTTIFSLACLASRPSREDLLLIWRPGWWVIPLGIGYSLLIRIAAGVAIVIIVVALIGTHAVTADSAQKFITTKRPDVGKLIDVAAMRHNPTYYWLTVTMVSFVVAGLREEMWRAGTLAGLRALWPRSFGSVRGQLMAVALISILFGAAHQPLGRVGIVVAGLLGLFLGVIMVLHRSIWPAVIAHGVLDATTFALLPFALEKLQHFH